MAASQHTATAGACLGRCYRQEAMQCVSLGHTLQAVTEGPERQRRSIERVDWFLELVFLAAGSTPQAHGRTHAAYVVRLQIIRNIAV